MRTVFATAVHSRIACALACAALILLCAGGAAYAQVSWPIAASSGDGGVINPAGTVYVPDGAAATFTFVPAPGFAVSQVIVDGVVAAGNVPGYTIYNIHSQQSIYVAFAPIQYLPPDYGDEGYWGPGPGVFIYGDGGGGKRDEHDFSRRGSESRSETHGGGEHGGGAPGGGHGGGAPGGRR